MSLSHWACREEMEGRWWTTWTPTGDIRIAQYLEMRLPRGKNWIVDVIIEKDDIISMELVGIAEQIKAAVWIKPGVLNA